MEEYWRWFMYQTKILPEAAAVGGVWEELPGNEQGHAQALRAAHEQRGVCKVNVIGMHYGAAHVEGT